MKWVLCVVALTIKIGVICYQMNEIHLAIRVPESLVDKNPSDLTYYYFLLSFTCMSTYIKTDS